MPSRKRRPKLDSKKRRAKSPAAPELRSLTPRELDIFEWILEAKRTAAIGKILECSPRTVQKHVQNILRKLHLETRIEVCAWWYERQLAAKNQALLR